MFSFYSNLVSLFDLGCFAFSLNKKSSFLPCIQFCFSLPKYSHNSFLLSHSMVFYLPPPSSVCSCSPSAGNRYGCWPAWGYLRYPASHTQWLWSAERPDRPKRCPWFVFCYVFIKKLVIKSVCLCFHKTLLCLR